MLSALRRAVRGARESIQTRARDVWRRDRGPLRGVRALANRILRISIIAIRGIWAHRLGLHAAALTYYTVFSLVPLLVVSLWVLKAFDRLPSEAPAMPVATQMTRGNAALHAVLQKLFENLNHTAQVTSGIVGLIALLYTVVRLSLCGHGTGPRPRRFVDDAEATTLPVVRLPGAASPSTSLGRGRRPDRGDLRHSPSGPQSLGCSVLPRDSSSRLALPWASLGSGSPLRSFYSAAAARPGSPSPQRRSGQLWRRFCLAPWSGHSPNSRSGCREETASNSERPLGPVFLLWGLLFLVRRAVRGRDRRGPQRRSRVGARRVVLPPRRRGGTGDRPRDHAAGHAHERHGRRSGARASVWPCH